jgi:hypothetical protein
MADVGSRPVAAAVTRQQRRVGFPRGGQVAHWRRGGERPAVTPTGSLSTVHAEAGGASRIKQDDLVSTRTLIVLAALCAVAILAASAVQVLLAR